MSPMPWRCPACSTPIRHQLTTAGDETPLPGRIYRCSVCHLELVLDAQRAAMIIAPLPSDTADDRPRRKRSKN